MSGFKSVIVLIYSVIGVLKCAPRRKQLETVQTYNNRTGEATARDDLIQAYETEHKKFYEGKTEDGNQEIWSVLKKNLTEYCRMYLQHSVPTITIGIASGTHYRGTLYYEKENKMNKIKISIVQCKIMRHYPMHYYLAQAPEPNCVYALGSIGFWNEHKYTIINKHCNFEGKPFIERPPKRKRAHTIEKKLPKTGEPIAKEEFLLKYELEHQELLKKNGKYGNCINWPQIMNHLNLSSYCYQYLKVCIPGRSHEGVSGSCKCEKLHYQKLNTDEDICITVVKCQLPDVSKRAYYLTRVPETNCAYALTRQLRNGPYVIIYKHCDFENAIDQQDITQPIDKLNKNVIPRTQAKEEKINVVKMLQLFPTD